MRDVLYEMREGLYQIGFIVLMFVVHLLPTLFVGFLIGYFIS